MRNITRKIPVCKFRLISESRGVEYYVEYPVDKNPDKEVLAEMIDVDPGIISTVTLISSTVETYSVSPEMFIKTSIEERKKKK